PSAGVFTVTLAGAATGTGPYLGETATSAYEVTVVVPPSGVGGALHTSPAVTDPHPGTIIYYSGATGGARTLDPAQAIDGASLEPILSVYESLVMYNGSETGPSPSDFLPVLAACVPGPQSSSCQSLYGSTLYNQSSSSYTFPLARGSMFYDPSTGQGWPVFPSDVLFSVARAMSFADLPGKGANNGWILSQALLPGTASAHDAANVSWDNGLHYPYNNTPQNILGSMVVNGSACPVAATTNGNPGCITFIAHGNDQPWPYFLELVADPAGGSVASCGWESSTASSGGQAGLPDWTGGAPTSDLGDHPCRLPGGATSSTSAAYIAAVGQMAPTAWDQYQYVGATSGIGNVYKAMVGSGAFYLPSNGYLPGISYMLRASPVYAPNPECTFTGCMPPRGHTARTVEVTWETDPAQGEQALASGVADFAAIPSTDAPLALQLIQQGKLSAREFPTLTISLFNFNMNFDRVTAQTLTSNPISVPPDWFSYLGMRQFFATAYPYTTIQASVLTTDGFTAGFPFGGAIPQFMANYYPTNISWPAQDPSQSCAGVGATTDLCPTWWWAQITNASSPYYDPEAAACSVSQPCQLPIMGTTGFPQLDQQMALWQRSIAALSGGRIQVSATDLNYLNLDLNGFYSSPGQNALPLFASAWSPDYPDPTDYVGPLYEPSSTFTYPDAVAQQLSLYAGPACPTGYAYYASLPLPVSQGCEGAAYLAMTDALQAAAVAPAGEARALLYNMAEHIANQLALYVYQYQSDETFTSAAWINSSTLDTNVTTGGGGILVWWTIGGNGVWGS
ncbi:MAG: periplasmic substrate-binding domain-containing protein, partial [Thermoplasmata archaeon]